LPEAVAATMSVSCPASTTGIARRCTSVNEPCPAKKTGQVRGSWALSCLSTIKRSVTRL